MLGHDDVGPQGEIETATGGIEGFEKPLTSTIPAQERQSPEAREGQLVSVARLVVTLVPFSVLVGHAGTSVGQACFRGPMSLWRQAWVDERPRKHGTRRH